MEAGKTLLGQILQEVMTPVLLLLPTPAVEESCAKNNLSFRDMLRPFSKVDDIDVPVRTASDQPYRLQEFRVRMYYSAEICQTSTESAEERLLKLINDSSDEAFAELPGDPQDIEVIKKMLQTESLSSWFQRYSNTFIQTLGFSEHETFDHSIACIRAVSSRDDNPIHKFVELYDTDPMPTYFSDGTMDPKLLKIYILVHDYQDGPADRANDILSEMRGTFGFNECWLLCINSGSSESTVDQPVWRPDMLHTTASVTDVTGLLSDRQEGSLLSERDVGEIKDLFAQVCCKSILPYMEQKIRSLNQQVVATKKGLKNQIRNLWWRKGKDEVSESTNTSMYTIGSIESQIRVLADYAFMLHDYELALSNYRLISSDYKADKAWKHYAGAQEMIGLSLFMLDQSRKEAELAMESAFSTYQARLVPSGQRYSTRCALWWAEMHKARGQYREAANVFFRAGAEEPHLRAGVFLEQAAYCFLRATPPMMRKYGFFLVLAGNRYNVCGQKKHALRAYLSVLHVFEGQGWNYISDHVIYHLGRLSANLGNSAAAVEHFRKLIACSHQSPVNQEAYLREFLRALENANFGKMKLLLLDLPIINKESIRVHFEDRRTYASVAASLVPDDIWASLEMGLVPSDQPSTKTWLDAALSKKLSAEEVHYNESIAGEALTVDVELINPLQISLNLSSISLLCKFNGDATHWKEGLPEFKMFPDYLLEPDWKQRVSSSEEISETALYSSDRQGTLLTVVEESITLSSGERHKVQLKVTPHVQGLLYIVGVKWILSGIGGGYQMFELEEPKRDIGTGKRNKMHVCPPHKRLRFLVREHMPRLEASLHGMPERIHSGELCLLVLELSNTSNVTLKNLKFCTSQPGLMLMGESEDLDTEFPNCLESPFVDKQEIQEESVIKGDFSSSVFSFPQDVILEGGSTLLWPLWLYGRDVGTMALNSVLYYESSSPSTNFYFRTIRSSHVLEVLPSLQSSVHISASLLQLEHSLLRLDIENKHNSENFWLRQVSCIGNRWQITPLLPPVTNCTESGERMSTEVTQKEAAFLSASVSPSQLLPAGQKLSLFFQLTGIECREEKVTYFQSISNIRLGPPSSSVPLIDVAKGPLAKFHKLTRESKDKEVRHLSLDAQTLQGSTLDLIVISEQQEEPATGRAAAMRDGQRLLTQYLCHCSPKQSSPLVWRMEGPSRVSHSFSNNFSCMVSFCLTIKNYSLRRASVMVRMGSSDNHATEKRSMHMGQGDQSGWYDLSLGSSSDADGQENKIFSHSRDASHPSPPFVWSSLNQLKTDQLCGGETVTYPLQLSVFTPGIFDLSGYHVYWEFHTELNMESGTEQKGAFCGAPTTYSSSYEAPDVHAANADLLTNTEQNHMSGSGYGHPFILVVESQ
ncbi:hypothetical protein KP509_10G018000 [Ceratopteris richardii]|uniref:Trafficking protein particle complex subunit 8 n=1 Tax=Ceratopteris richardii TaxID=49495 RepID=A0A8T2TYT2_CERRI|nr:hypothetical protein KP509_10G018000 [Ceratopteris richardii]